MAMIDFDEVDALRVYEAGLEAPLGGLDIASALLFGWSACQHLLGMYDEFHADGMHHYPLARSIIQQGWEHALGRAEFPVIDGSALEAQVPLDAAGVATGERGAWELGSTLAELSGFASTDELARLVNLASSVVDYCDFSDLMAVEAEEQQALIKVLQGGGADPAAVWDRAVKHGLRLGQALRKLEYE